MSRKPDDWMPLHIGEYLADTTHLTRDQHGAYLLLIMTYWRRGEALPADDGQLAAAARATPAEWRKMRPIISPFFTERDGKWFQKRCEEELAKARAHVAQRSVAGKASAAVRDRQRKGNGRSTAVQRDGQREGQRNVNEISDQEPSTKYQEPLSSADSKTAAREDVEFSADAEEFAKLAKILGFDGNDHRNWLEFVAMKTRHGLEFEAHILAAARHHAAVGKVGKTLAYIRPKAIELRDAARVAATAPVVFEDCSPSEWAGRLRFWCEYSGEKWEAQWGPRWKPKWGPLWSSPDNRVPPDVLTEWLPRLRAAAEADAAHAERMAPKDRAGAAARPQGAAA